jgi:hypothetical protein
MTSSTLLLCMLAGCSFSASVDAEGDAAVGPPDACGTFSDQLDTCALQVGPAVELNGQLEFNTLNGQLTNKQTGQVVAVYAEELATKGDPVYAIIAQKITLAPNTTLRALGPKGFALIAIDSITIGTNSLVDVSDNGAGARLVACEGAPQPGQDDTGGAAGGGGAGFAAVGGKGGDGNSDALFGNTSDGGNAGAAIATPPLGPRGGCLGARGGNGNEVGGTGGRGGGAVWLAAGRLLELAQGSGINAGGSGGGGGIRTNSQGDAGGGGGGSGGVIWIESPRVRSSGVLAANGGGGGEGSGGDASGALGHPGSLGIGRALGGDGASNSGAGGGAGGHLADENGLKAANPLPGGGGGGGGSVGFIRVLSRDSMLSVVSPSL